MADVKKTVSIIFRGDDQLSSTVKTIAGRVDAFEADLQSIAQPLATVADGVLKLDAALALFAVGGIVYAYKKSSEFESAIVELQKVMGDQPEAIREAADAAIDLSNKYGEASTTILQSTADFKQAGFDVQDAMGLTKDAMDLVIAGSIEADQASEILISTLKGFRAPAEDARRLMDILNATSNEYATGVGELGVGIATLSPILKQMGFTFEESAGLLTPVIEVFRSGEESARGLRTGLLRLTDDTSSVVEALDTIGVAQRDQNGEMRSGKDILRDVQEAWGGLSDSQKTYIAQSLAGTEQASKMAVVFDTLAYQLEITNKAYESTGSIAGEVQARLESSEVALRRFVAGLQNLGILIGDEINEAATETVLGATEIELALQRIIKAGTFDPVFETVSDFGNKLADLLREIAKELPEAMESVDLSPLLEALGNIQKEVADFFTELDLTKPEDLARAIQFVVDSTASLINTTAGMVNTFQPILEGIFSTIEGFNRLDAESQEAAGGVLGAAKAIVDAGGLIAGALVVIGGHAEEVKRVFQVLIGTVQAAWNTLEVAFSSLVLGVAEGVDTFLAFVEALNFSLGLGGLNTSIKEARAEILRFQEAVEAERMTDMTEGVDGLSLALRGVTGAADKAKGAVDAIPGKKETRIEATGIEEALAKIRAVPIEAAEVAGEVKTEIKVEPDQESIKKTIRTVDEEIPRFKELEVKASVDIERLKALQKTAEAYFEYKGRIEIANLEHTQAIFENMGETLRTNSEASADILSAAFGSLGDVSSLHFYDVMDLIEDEQRLRRQNLEEQKELNAAQAEYLRQRTKTLQSGTEALIRISGDGLEPELEAFMWKILQRIQVRATQDNAEFLLGI